MYILLTMIAFTRFFCVAHITEQVLHLVANSELPEHAIRHTQCLTGLVIRTAILFYVCLDRVNRITRLARTFLPRITSGYLLRGAQPY